MKKLLWLIVFFIPITCYSYTLNLTSTSESGLKYTDFTQVKDILNGYDSSILSTVGTGSIDSSGTPVSNDIALFYDADTLMGYSAAEFKSAMDLEAGTDFYSVSGADAAFQPLSTILTAINGGVTTMTGSGAALVRWTSPTINTPYLATPSTNMIVFDDANAAVSSVGQLTYDNTITGFGDGALVWNDGDDTRIILDLDPSIGTLSIDDHGKTPVYNWFGGQGYFNLQNALTTFGTPSAYQIPRFVAEYAVEGLSIGDFKDWVGLEVGVDIQAYSSVLLGIAGGSITTNLLNVAYPWADNEVDNNLTINAQADSSWLIANSINPQALMSGNILQDVNNTAYPWEDDEVDNDLTINAQLGSTWNVPGSISIASMSELLDSTGANYIGTGSSFYLVSDSSLVSNVLIDLDNHLYSNDTSLNNSTIYDGCDGLIINGYTAGEDITIGRLVCIDRDTGMIVHADNSDDSRYRAIGLAAANKLTGNTIPFMSQGVYRNSSMAIPLSVGSAIYLSAYDGFITQTPPTTSGYFSQVVGVALDSSVMLINISLDGSFIP